MTPDELKRLLLLMRFYPDDDYSIVGDTIREFVLAEDELSLLKTKLGDNWKVVVTQTMRHRFCAIDIVPAAKE